ncbi:hypothetical protein WISP_00001 [Willisornis vidua]|uniref:Uncharacterized protein n=1 Tax=Willisornis vidua TaxID=1566151 RepID=A0ABQ9DVJ6_9PASS|nr:hypothetical protein WISP_00001 [Willisornis vidua]
MSRSISAQSTFAVGAVVNATFGSITELTFYISVPVPCVISAQSTFAVGAVVNATFGSITELTFYISALLKGSREGSACYAEVVKAALTGTLVGCVLFVPVRVALVSPGARAGL